MLNCFYDCYCILNKVYSDKAFIKQAMANTVIEEKNKALTTKICYGVLDKDIELSYYISLLTEKTPKLVIRTILKIAMYCIKYLNKKEYAVVKNAVELTKKLGKGGASGFVNAFLRKFESTEIAFPDKSKDLIKYLSIKYSYPEFAVRELLKTYDENRVESIISTENGLNTLVFYDVDGEKYLKDNNVTFEKTPFDNVFLVKNFIRNKDYDSGVYTFQALGSVAICEAIKSCDKILDCCSAPGGKSVRLSFRCGEVYSWDIHEHRVELIKDYAKRMNRENIQTKVTNSKIYDSSYEEFFDAVLCDAPCSGIGVLNDNPDIKMNRNEYSILELSKEQLSILNNVKNYVKKGGYLYYSTCSILDSENISVVKQFLKDNADFEIEPLNSKLQHEDILGTNQFLPDISRGLGFYVAVLRRKS